MQIKLLMPGISSEVKLGHREEKKRTENTEIKD